jgi:hypothetical protein
LLIKQSVILPTGGRRKSLIRRALVNARPPKTGRGSRY